MPHQCLKCGVLFNEGTTTILRGCPDCRGTRFFYTQVPLTMSEREKLLATSEITLREAIDQLVKKAHDGDVTDLPKSPDEWVKVTVQDTPATTPTAASAAPRKLEDFETKAPEPTPKPVTFTPVPPPVETKQAPKVAEPQKSETAWFIGKKLLIKRTPTAAPPPRRRKDAIQFDYAPPAPVLETPRAFKTEPAPLPAAANPEPQPTSPPRATPATAASPEVEVITPIGDGPPETIRIGKPGEYEIDVKRLMESNPIVIQRDGTYLIHLASLFESNRPKDD